MPYYLTNELNPIDLKALEVYKAYKLSLLKQQKLVDNGF